MGAPRITHTHVDRIGSITSLTDVDKHISSSSEAQLLLQRRSYDSFGRVFEASATTDLSQLLGTRQGFTGHEHLPTVGLIHMNGRGYDPMLGRFLSVDPFIQSPSNTQSINPYSYLMNNPLAGTDPTGYVGEFQCRGGSTDASCADIGGDLGAVAARTCDEADIESCGTVVGNSAETAEDVGGFVAGDGGTNQSKAPTDDSFNLFDPATYPGVDAGENAAMYWAQKHVDTGNPLYAIPGVFASLWTPDSAGHTALTLSGEGLFAVGAKVLQGIKGLRTTGALADDVASTFRFGRYSEVTLAESKTLTRFYDNTNAFAKGRYMTDASALSSSTFLNRMGLALRPNWNGMTKQAHWTVPAGSTIYKGKAATQFPWIGGKTQYFVPNISNVKRVSGN